MKSYYLVKFKEALDTDKGVKWMPKQCLIEAVSITDAEVVITSYLEKEGARFNVNSISISPIEFVL
jgi:hypothetical protein